MSSHPSSLSRRSPRFSRLLALLLAGAGVAVAQPESNRLINLSTRGTLGEGSRVMTAGFVVSPGEPKTLLIRGAGPSLRTFGIESAAADARLTIFDSAQKIVAENDNWDAALAPVFATAGAFAWTPGSRDAALQLTLAPGLYTAQLQNPDGVGMIEVYDLGATPKLINLSTRGWVSSGDGALIAGLYNNPGLSSRRVLVRAVGPSLRAFGLADALADPVLTIYDGQGRVTASNDNWGDANGDALASAMSSAGAFQIDRASRDAAVIVELGGGTHTFRVDGVGGSSGVALIEVYDLMPVAGRSVGVTASPAVTSVGGAPAQLVFSRSGNLDTALTVSYRVTGDARPGVDYAALAGTLVFPAGLAEAAIPVSVLSLDGTDRRSVSVEVLGTEEYDVKPGAARVDLYLGPGTLFLASLRPLESASGSPAFGSSLLQLTSDERYLVVDVDVSGLSSPQTLAYLRMQDASGATFDLVRLPLGQVTDFLWEVRAGSGFTAADVLANLRAGRVFVQIETQAHPTGELGGRYAAAAGTRDFTPPAEPAPASDVIPDAVAAARFLTQATFGPRSAELDTLPGQSYRAWIDAQMALPATLHQPATLADFAAYPPSPTSTAPGGSNRMAAWWKTVLKSDDQLRQRVAFALSEILVVSDANGTLNDRQEALARYYDILVQGAFGDFRQVLQQVTLSPVMGVYLSSLRNAKATSPTGAQPDENYAREVMQLFTIGLWELQPDGTLRLGTTGKPLATYQQTTITEMAKVFTGWGFYSTAAKPSFRGAPSDYLNPMMLYPAFHDDTAKTIVGGLVLPAAQGGVADLNATLDALVAHSNTGPFLARQLIQRLVTSNPSPAYVYRVARVFADNGQGRRGDLGAVVRAILLDPEARDASAREAVGQGKLKEPLLRLTALLRGLEVSTATGRFPYGNPESALGQAALRSPTVFNFFEPGYAPPGAVSDAGLRGPEFQILNANTAISVPNSLYSHLYGTPNGFTLDFSPLIALVSTPSQLVARINLLLCSGRLSSTEQARIVQALGAVPRTTSDLERARLAVYLAVTTSAGAVQH